ncbi:MAG: outer membrane protein, partial [Notoacmeibacter sp.]
MFKVLKSLLIVSCSIAGTLTGALAADLDQPIFVEQAPEYQPVEVGNGWYIRGDIGYAASHEGGTHTFRTFNPLAVAPVSPYADQTFATSNSTSDFSIGGGIGYQFSDWLRFDGTIDAYKGKFNGTTSATGPCSTDPAFLNTACATNDTQGFDAYQFMANAYVDLGTYVGITPYVGAGAGYTVVSYGDLTNSLYCVPTALQPVCPPTAIAPVTHEGATEARFTYSAMAGLAYQASKSVKLDLGYRYSRIAAGD